MNVMKEVEEYFSGKLGPSNVSIFKPYNFKMEEIEAFRYRAQDAMRVVTSIAIREARLKEIKRELLTSVKLKVSVNLLSLRNRLNMICFRQNYNLSYFQAYFKENPKDFAVLRHDKPSHTIKIHSHLKDVPDYIGQH